MATISNIDSLSGKGRHSLFASDLRETTGEGEAIIVYKGKIDQVIIKAIAGSIHQKLEDSGAHLKIKKLMFHVIIELLQNVCKYSDDKVKGKGAVLIKETTDKFLINVSNEISNDKVAHLIFILDLINNQLLSGYLNGLFQAKIVHGKFHKQGGVGLGLIDIARKTKQKLEYIIRSVNNTSSVFYINVSVLKNSNTDNLSVVP